MVNRQLYFQNGMNSYIKKHFSLILLLFLLGVGFYLRAVGVFSNSFAFTYDVGRDMLQVQQIAIYHKIPLIGQTTGLGGLFYGPWWYYILTPPFILTHGNPQGIVFFMVLLGVTAILAGYILGNIVQGKTLGLILATLISLSSAMIGFSNQIWNPNIAPLFVVLVFTCLFLLEKSKSNKLLLFLTIGLLLGLILDSEIVFGVLFVSGLVLVLLYIMKKRIVSLPSLGVILGFFIILSPRIFFELRHQFVMTKSLFMPHTQDQQIFDVHSFFIVLPDRAVTLLSQFKDTFGLQTNLISSISLVVIVLVFILLYKKLKTNERKLLISCLIILAVFLVGSALFARAVWGHYLVGLPVIYIFIVSLAFLLLYRRAKVLTIILLIVFAVFSVRPLEIVSSYNKPLWEGNAAVYRNQVAVIDYVYQQARKRPFNEIVYTPVVHDYTYQYLFSWYGKNKYGYIPSKPTKKLFYVIIEPDPGSEWRITDWLKIRIGDGKVVKEQVVKGGIKVQTRTR